jgi:hypothetical protein
MPLEKTRVREETTMSQASVERVIGVLVTDEALRRRFVADPRAMLEDLAARGFELTGCERRALASIDAAQLTRFAEAIDDRLQKSDLRGSSMPYSRGGSE